MSHIIGISSFCVQADSSLGFIEHNRNLQGLLIKKVGFVTTSIYHKMNL